MRFILKAYPKKSKEPFRYATANLNRFAQKFSLTCKNILRYNKVFLKIQYNDDVENAGYYRELKELQKAYRAFTDRDLIKYATSEGW